MENIRVNADGKLRFGIQLDFRYFFNFNAPWFWALLLPWKAG
jgi:hypothetical protein